MLPWTDTTTLDQRRAFIAAWAAGHDPSPTSPVRSNGEIKWAGERVFLSAALIGEPVGLVPYDDRRRSILFGHMEIGLLDGPATRIIKTPVRVPPMCSD